MIKLTTDFEAYEFSSSERGYRVTVKNGEIARVIAFGTLISRYYCVKLDFSFGDCKTSPYSKSDITYQHASSETSCGLMQVDDEKFDEICRKAIKKISEDNHDELKELHNVLADSPIKEFCKELM